MSKFIIIISCLIIIFFCQKAEYFALEIKTGYQPVKKTLPRANRVDTDNYAIMGSRKVFLKIADTPKKQLQGLMYIKTLPENLGMIFLFKSAEQRSFWMKNVEIPLDIIFIRNKKIITIHKNITVTDENRETLYNSVYKSDCVIEVNGNFCDKYNIKIGDLIYLSPGIIDKWNKVKETAN